MTHLKLKPLSKQTSLIDTMQNSGQPANPNRRDGLYDTNSRLSDAASRTGLCSNPAPTSRQNSGSDGNNRRRRWRRARRMARFESHLVPGS